MSKICPVCNTQYKDTDKFCSRCEDANGMPVRLIEEPSLAPFGIKLGDANAISGGINTTITTTYEAQKTEMELLQEKKNIYLAECKRAYEDNVLEQSEIIALEECRLKLGLDEATAKGILESVRLLADRNTRKTSLNPIAKTKLKILSDNLQNNNVPALQDQIGNLEAIVNKFEHDELHRKYFLTIAVLNPKKCIELKESSQIDSYWKSYWCYLAYIKEGMQSKAETLLAGMDRFADYPEDNVTILAIAGSLISGNVVEAKELLSAVTGEYTTELQRFVDSIYLLLDPETAKEMGADESDCAFYLTNLFVNVNPDGNTAQYSGDDLGAETECTMPYTCDDETGTFTGIVVDGIPVRGAFTTEEGTFEGEFVGGKPFKGVLRIKEGGCFEGEFCDGAPHNGAFKDAQIGGVTVSVIVSNGDFNGYGKMLFPEGGSFEGEFKDGSPVNGICNDYVCDGCIMTGRFVNGELEGFGSIRFEDGSRFEGELKAGEPFNGKMFDCVMENGEKRSFPVRDGDFQMDDETFWDILEKAMSETTASEAVDEEKTIPYSFNDLSGTFKGTVVDGKPQKGQVSFEEGGSYEGEFKDGDPYTGVFSDVPYDENEGSTITVKIEGGQFREGVIHFANGCRFEGELDDGEPYNGMMFNYKMKDGSIVDSKVVKGRIEAVEEAKRKAEEERKAEEARIKALRKKITYTLSITSVADPIQAMMTARAAFGWGVVEYRQNVAQLPTAVFTSGDLAEIKNLQSTLQKGGMGVEISAQNALGENVGLDTMGKKTANKTRTRKK